MTFFEAKIRAMCNTQDEIFEKAYDYKIPQELKDKHLQEALIAMKPIMDWVENLKDKQE